ncbi:dual specificity protein phosphatase family protein [Roseimaritima sediminicola]|uniref:dual specificity protein phosphatase family protein n=1 Tax=Roseimaritima sediminicola TaxID=2662066 RepID=UPI0012985551|nr:dual specificity protein phosphatase family protein [Roseimaritima sediminicola]
MLPPRSLQRFYARSVFYPTLWWNMLHGRVLKVRSWSTRVDPHLIVGAYPFARDVPRMTSEGVKAVVNTCEEYPGPLDAYRLAGIEQLHIPTVDFTHPRLEDVQRAVEFIQDHAAAGSTTYVHCKAGRARSATVALCWMVKYRQLSAEEAQAQLLKLRPHVNPRVARRPVVQAFIEGL